QKKEMNIKNLIKWDGENWKNAGIEIDTGGIVEALEVINDKLYVGGSFAVKNHTVKNLICLNGNQWEAVEGGENIDGYIDDIIAYKNELYLAGWFNSENFGLEPSGIIRLGLSSDIKNMIPDEKDFYLA